MSKKIKSKVLVFSVRLKGVGPESRKRLMAAGLDKDMTLVEQEVSFKDERGWGFKHPMFLRAVMEKEDELLKAAVECVVREKKARRKK